jgi:hypothetical protein
MKMAPFPHWLTVAFSVIAVIGTVTAITKKESLQQAAQVVVGHEIQNSGPGVGQVIDNSGGGVGGSVNVVVPAGTSAIGTRIIQSGPGTGLVVRQTGPGVGFQSTVIVGPGK